MPSKLDDAVPVARPVDSPYQVAAQHLEKAAQSGQPQAWYLLALACKRLGRLGDARNALRKIANPGAPVFLQLGILSLQENNLAQAEQELTRAHELDSANFAIAHNLLMTRLSLGRTDCSELTTRVAALAAPERRPLFLYLRELLLRLRDDRPLTGEEELDSPLATMSHDDEAELLALFRSLGNIDALHTLTTALARVRPRSGSAQTARYEATLLKARDLIRRGCWTAVRSLLTPLASDRTAPRTAQVCLHLLLGCACVVTQDFHHATLHFSAALRLHPSDPRLYQNLALTSEFEGNLLQAESWWNRFFDLLASNPVAFPPGWPAYLDRLEFEALCRLAQLFHDQEKWTSVVTYLQRAHRLFPDDEGVLEKLFHVYHISKQFGNARRTLDRLRQLCPGDPRLDLFELDLIEIKSLSDVEKMLHEIDRVVRKHPDDTRVLDRANALVGSIVPLMHNLFNQFSEQLSRIANQIDRLNPGQIDWRAVKEVTRELSHEFLRLRRIVGKCLSLVRDDDQARAIRLLTNLIDQKLEACRGLGA